VPENLAENSEPLGE